MDLTRRSFATGMLALPGCTALNALSDASAPRDTFALQPVEMPRSARRSARTLLVLEPQAAAAVSTDRILIREEALAVTYLPDARWAQELPAMLQMIVVQSLASTGAFGFVGPQGAGPVPDAVVLMRLDAFGAERGPDGQFSLRVAYDVTILRDRDQRVLGTRRFQEQEPIADDRTGTIVQGFQSVLETLLPETVDWITRLAA
ncbi:MAG: ABC-type transport auxiliary lipoprotein family protein [Pseudomonadota bacterium]